jgi:predicted alpha/beta hydrolase
VSGAPTGSVEPRRLRVKAPAGHQLSVDYLSGPESAAVVIIIPAMGVRASSYRRFAAALRQRRLDVAVADLRGTGSSVPSVDSSARFGYHELATVDLPLIVDTVRAQAPELPVIVLGHSLGGQIAPMFAARWPNQLAGLALIAAGTPHYRAFRNIGGLAGAVPLLGTSIIAAVARVRGYWPGDRLGFAGRQSRVLVADWARLARTGRFRPSGADVNYEDLMARLDLPVLAVSVGADRFAPVDAVDALLECLPRARITRRHHAPPLGHLGWIKQSEPIADLLADWVFSDPLSAGSED